MPETHNDTPCACAAGYSVFSRTPAFRLAERWLNDALKRIEIFEAERGEGTDHSSLRTCLKETRSWMATPPQESTIAKGLMENLALHLRVRDYRPAEVEGSYWLRTPMGEIPLLSMPSGPVSELTYRSKAHVLMGLADDLEHNPSATGFLFLSCAEECRRFLAAESHDQAWLGAKNILLLDPWSLRVLLKADRCALEAAEVLGLAS